MKRLTRTRTMLVIGNGSTGVDRDGRRYTHEGTGQFLVDLANSGVAPTYVEIATAYTRNANLQNYCLDDHGIASALVPVRPRVARARALTSVAWRALRADYVYAFYPGTLSRAIAALRALTRRPYGLYVRGEHYLTDAVDRYVLRTASFALTVSPRIEQDIKRLCRSAATIRPMLGMDVHDRTDRPIRESAPDLWKLLFVGRLEEDKGLREITDAARILKTKGFPFRLRVVGGGPLFETLQAVVRADDLAGAIEVVGQLMTKGELLREYADADILVCASHNEGFPRVLYEAMLASLPIITTFVGGIPGRMQDGVNCLRIPERDPAAIAAAIETLAGDLELLQRLGRAGQATVLGVLREYRQHAELVMEKVNGGD